MFNFIAFLAEKAADCKKVGFNDAQFVSEKFTFWLLNCKASTISPSFCTIFSPLLSELLLNVLASVQSMTKKAKNIRENLASLIMVPV